MRRLLATIIVALFSLGLATQVSAQEIKLSKAVPAKQIIDILGNGQVKYDAEIPSTVTYAGQLDADDPRGAIDTVLQGTAFEAIDKTDGIHIRHRPSQSAAAATITAPVIPAYNPRPTDLGSNGGSYTAALAAMQQNAQTNAARTAAIYQAELSARRMQEDNSMSYATTSTPGAAMPLGATYYDQLGQVASGRAAGFDYQGGFYGGYNPIYLQRQIDLDTWGALRFKKGKESFLENVEVWCGGQRVTQGDEGNNIWDKPVRILRSCAPLTFRYSDGKADWEVEVNELIPPMRLGIKDITIDEKYFARARKMTEYRKYSLVEQPDGSFKRVER